ncbi:MAG: hotdog fold thioesterase [Crocinitomix sp.]|nr:hotdog fold thioesterase [Crocinitomix sp.]
MTHFDRLIKMYAKAPIHTFYKDITLEVTDKESTVTLPIRPDFFHGGMSTHGSVYFKLLDDAAYFACQSVIEDYFIVTTNFNISLLRPITKGTVTAIGKMDFNSQQLFTAAAELFDERGRLCGKGQGQFMKSKLSLSAVEDY